MSFDAYRLARNAAQAAMTDTYPGILAALNATAKPLRKVYRHTRGDPKAEPFGVIGQATGTVNDDAAIASDVALMVMVVASGANPDELDARMDAYLTALVRTFAGLTVGELVFQVVAFDSDPPAPYADNSPLLQTCGVELHVHTVESR